MSQIYDWLIIQGAFIAGAGVMLALAVLSLIASELFYQLASWVDRRRNRD